LKNTRTVVAGLAIIALVLSGLIYRDVFVPTKNAASSLNLQTVARRTVTSSVAGTGNIEPQAQANVNFKVAGTLTEIDVRVGDHVALGQKLAVIDSTPQQVAVSNAQANVATAQANLQSAQTPLTQNQITQLQNAVNNAQQSYNDTVAQVNLTNTQDANQVAADQNQLAIDQQALTFNATYQTDLQNLNTAKTNLQTAIATFNADGCQSQTYATYTPTCMTDFNAVSAAQTTVNTNQAKVNLDAAQVTADQTKLTTDQTKQQTNTVTGQRSINQAAASLTSSRDQLRTQTEAKPNQIASAQAQLASAQAALQTAQQSLNYTTLTAPMDGQVNSINGVVGETVAPGGGATAQAPGAQAPLPTTAATSAFMVIGNTGAMDVVIPFAESDASRIAADQDAAVTFDAVSSLNIAGKVLAVASSATTSNGVVNYYVTVQLNQTNNALKQGMTANATVVVSRATNAITVPNLAITRSAGQAFVNVYVAGQQQITPIQTGVVGDQFTEVISGLTGTEQIVMPTVKVNSATGGATRQGVPGGGGGGGVRIGG
jgi:HlyD family secretion protein